ncbi:HNH endonuclease [Niabella sp. CC-SYL272]|uniref:HNH endonuclease n=1 Tax=Niabella agricola TaxID=2891571 RepID=UPI001F2186E5|nr:HNH endonuclease [Niabella agricola]MCF3107315.1 HNH endonuclease [Niabella agricola]
MKLRGRRLKQFKDRANKAARYAINKRLVEYLRVNDPEYYGKTLCRSYYQNIIRFLGLESDSVQMLGRVKLRQLIVDEYSNPFSRIYNGRGEHGSVFYTSDKWLSLRDQALTIYGKVCMKCGRKGYAHVDHIRPRSTYPQYELNFNNLQILCADCNMEKGNKNEIDYRPDWAKRMYVLLIKSKSNGTV